MHAYYPVVGAYRMRARAHQVAPILRTVYFSTDRSSYQATVGLYGNRSQSNTCTCNGLPSANRQIPSAFIGRLR